MINFLRQWVPKAARTKSSCASQSLWSGKRRSSSGVHWPITERIYTKDGKTTCYKWVASPNSYQWNGDLSLQGKVLNAKVWLQITQLGLYHTKLWWYVWVVHFFRCRPTVQCSILDPMILSMAAILDLIMAVIQKCFGLHHHFPWPKNMGIATKFIVISHLVAE